MKKVLQEASDEIEAVELSLEEKKELTEEQMKILFFGCFLQEEKGDGFKARND